LEDEKLKSSGDDGERKSGDTAAMILVPEVTDMTMATDTLHQPSPSPVLAKTSN
jgi:hypothetical protein